MNTERYQIKVTGIVQGVGFRPFVYSLASSLSLKGWVRNSGEGVTIDVEGDKTVLDNFVNRITNEAPPLSKIKGISVELKSKAYYHDFTIKKSIYSEKKDIFISPDVSICEDCAKELEDEKDRRYQYPFINCTNCGPRFTIIENIPYDRPNTTMKKFEMCDKCLSEYENPMDRRYHAQPVSCFECGPEMELYDSKGNSIVTKDIMNHTRQLIDKGYIISVKGLGGFHLICDACSKTAVARLRKRKIRDDKPFALMVRDYKTALMYCHINEIEKKLLESKEKPIVLLKKRENISLPYEIAPGNSYFGIMLPYTPVHRMLFGISNIIVATSGNKSSEPICYKDQEAFEELKDIADYFLTNNRDIHMRTDDTVTRVFRDREYIIRRSRGYVPTPISCEIFENHGLDILPSILACGGELKNTFCINKDKEFYISHHIGDLENEETFNSFESGIEHFKNLFNLYPEIVAYDLHPEYLSTKYALELSQNKKIPIQHHHAHIASCMAENNIVGDVIGVAFDGTGFGEDGHIWGGEFFSGSYEGFKREGHLEYVKMPGGEMAVREPWRMALSYLLKTLGSHESIQEINKIIKGIPPNKLNITVQAIEKNINSPLTSSLGRLFDAVSSLLDIRNEINYEGQAAIELEYIAEEVDTAYDFSINKEDSFEIKTGNLIKGILEDITAGISKGIISGKFHESISRMVLSGCQFIRNETGFDRVVLSGGVFQNMTLLDKSVSKLENNGFIVYTHSKVPTNDAGISLGQAAIAMAKTNKSVTIL